MTKRLSVAEAKARFSQVLRELEAHGGQVIVERRGRPVAVVEAYDRANDMDLKPHWADELNGIAADLMDFQSIMVDVVRSGRTARPRRIRLED